MSTFGSWYAVQTRSNMEQCVVGELAIKGIENLYPSYEELHQWADRKKLVTRPLFPGYVLVRCNGSAQSRLHVLQTHGVVRILGVGKQIEAIPEAQVLSVQQLLTSGKPCFPHPFLRTGAKVRVRRGPLKDIVGTLVRIKQQSRLVLSVDLIAKSVATEVDMRDIEVLDSAIGMVPAQGHLATSLQ
jgi:transcription antitermination factor NusG